MPAHDQADRGFPPVVGEQPKVLVLGSMPSQLSLKQGQYYGNPQNAFWWLMSQMFGFDLALPYESRVALVKQSGVAIWDVVFEAVRPGSMDANIQESALLTNDFATFFEKHPSIVLLVFNGKASQRLFRKHVNAEIDIPQLVLPSTSPAYAAMSRDDKLVQWQQILARL